jgi:hypothetical protein
MRSETLPLAACWAKFSCWMLQPAALVLPCSRQLITINA